MASFFVIGAFLFAFAYDVDHSVIREGEDCRVYGRICDSPVNKDSHSMYLLDNVYLAYGADVESFDSHVRVYSADAGLEYGDIVKFDTKLYVPDEEVIPGGGSERVYLALNGIGASVYSDDITVISHSDDIYGVFLNVRDSLGENIDNAFSKDTASVAKAMFLGVKDSLSDDIRNIFSAGGMAHILAISGLHIGIIIMLLSSVADKFIKKRNLRYALLLVLPILYAMLTGLPSSVVRVVIMVSFVTINKWLLLERDELTVLSFAMLVSLLIDPLDLFSAGFLLSYAAVFGILCIYPPIRRAIKRKELIGLPRSITEILGVSVAACTPTLPVSAYYFGSLSYISPLTSLLAVPLSSVIVVFTMIVSVLGFISSAAASFVAMLPQAVIKFLIITGRSLYDANIGYIDFYGVTVLLSSVIVACCFIMSEYVFVKMRIKVIICALLIAAASCFSFIPVNNDTAFKMIFLDCGYGHACVISENNEDVVITDGSSASVRGIETYSDNNRTCVKTVVLTHFGEEELRNTEELCKRFDELELIVCANTDTSFEEYCFMRNINVQKAGKYDNIIVNEILNLTPTETENGKMSLLISRGDDDICFYASHTARQLKYSYMDADVLKLYGAGGKGALSDEMLEKITPDACIVCADETSEYSVPDKETLDIIKRSGADIFRTDIHHSVTIRIGDDGEIITDTLNREDQDEDS